ERERRVVIEVRKLVAGKRELRRRRCDGRAGEDEIELGVVARHEPAADMPAVLVRQVSPRVAARLAGRRDRSTPPQLLTGAGVVRRDDASLGAALGLTAAPRDDLAVCN